MGSDDFVRGFSLFDPLLHGRDLIEVVWPFSARAMSHAWLHEEANPLGSLRGISAQRNYLLVEIHRRAGCDLLVCPAVIEQQFPIMLRKGGKMRIEFVHVLIDCVGLSRIAIQVKAA